MIARKTLLLATYAALATAAPLQAQDLSFGAAAGTAIPVGATGERRDPGPAARLSVEARWSRRWSLRLDGEWSLLNARSAPAGQERYDLYRDLRVAGISLNGARRFGEESLAPYVLAGVGAYRLQAVGGQPSPYGTTGALQAGIGLGGTFGGRTEPFVEARAMAHATDYGSDEFSATIYFPILIGLRIGPK